MTQPVNTQEDAPLKTLPVASCALCWLACLAGCMDSTRNTFPSRQELGIGPYAYRVLRAAHDRDDPPVAFVPCSRPRDSWSTRYPADQYVLVNRWTFGTPRTFGVVGFREVEVPGG